MKKLTIASILVITLAFITARSAQASNTASGAIGANIVSAISISNTAGLQFGQIIPSVGGIDGTVTIATDGTRSNNLTSAVLAGGVFGAATFTVTGTGTSTYTITLPATTTVTGAGAPMTVDTFTSNPSATGTLSAGTQNLVVGATLHVGAAQVAGTYVGSFNVTVAYN